MSLLSLLNKTCTIQRPTGGKGSVMGSTSYTYSSTTNVQCAVQVKTAMQTSDVFRAGEEIFTFYFPSGTDVKSQDIITAVTGYTDYTFTVKTGPQDDAGRSAYTRVLCQHIVGMTKP